MSQDSGQNFAITTSWSDLVLSAPLLASQPVYVCNLGWAPVLVVFSSSAVAPIGGGILVQPGAQATGTSAHIWVQAENGAAEVTAGLATPNQTISGEVIAVCSGDQAAVSSPLTATISDTATHLLGPFAPQIARQIWMTINATTSATGVAQLLRSNDGGTTKIGVTQNGGPAGSYQFAAFTGAIVNEPVLTETDATATYFLSITLSAGAVTVRLAQ